MDVLSADKSKKKKSFRPKSFVEKEVEATI